MKKLIIILTTVLAALSYGNANNATGPIDDTIKILAGDKQIIIISNNKNDQLKDLEQGIDEFEQKINTFQFKIDSLQKIIDSLSEQIDDTSISSAGAIKDSISHIASQIEDYQKFINALQKGIVDIQNQISEIQEEINSSDDSLNYDIYKYFEKKDKEPKKFKLKRKFRGHWGGLELGLSNFYNADNKILLNQTDVFSPNLTSSYNVNLNLLESNVKITSFFGLVTGLGFKFDRYAYSDFPYFDNETYVFNTDSMHSAYDNNGTIQKIIMKTTTIRIPLLVEIQFNKKRSIYINAGAYAGLMSNAKLKFVYDVSGKRVVLKQSLDNMVSQVNYGITTRIGLDKVQFYVDYSLTPVFKNPENPQLYQASAGLRISF